jgi:hypothetical protein
MAERSFLSSIELSSEGELGEEGMGMLWGSDCSGFVKASLGGVFLESVFLEFES